MANPIAILQGRIAFAVFGAYTFFQTVEPVVSLFHHARGFHSHPSFGRPFDAIPDANTEYRSLKFNFTGSVGHAYSLFFGGVILTYISMGILFPWWDCQKKQYLLGNLRYGNKRFESFPRAGVFYKCSRVYPHGDRDDLSHDLDIGGRRTFGRRLRVRRRDSFSLPFHGDPMGLLAIITTNHVMESTCLPGGVFQESNVDPRLCRPLDGEYYFARFDFRLGSHAVMVRNTRYRVNSTTVLAEDLDSFVQGQIEWRFGNGGRIGGDHRLGYQVMIREVKGKYLVAGSSR